MKYPGQHNGKGKVHLIDENHNTLCGNSGDFNHSTYTDLLIEDKRYFEVIEREEFPIKTEISKDYLYSVYCSKCLKKAK